MVTLLPESPGFGSRSGAALGGGIERGVSQMSDIYSQMALEKLKQRQRLETVTKAKELQGKGGSQTAPKDIKEQFMSFIPIVEQLTGKQLSGEEQNQIFNEFQKMSPEQRNMLPGMQSQQDARQGESQQDPFELAETYELLGEHGLSRLETEKASLKEKERIKKQETSAARHHDIAKESLKTVGKMAAALPQKKMALQTMVDAIENKDLSFFSPDNLAELTGISAFRTPEGAAFKTASKEFFLGNLSRVGAKGLNQWMEKVVQDMGPRLGIDSEANLAITEVLKAELDVQEKEIELTNQIADEMEKKYGHVRRDLSEQVMKRLTPYAIERQKAVKSRIEDIKDTYAPVNKEGELMRDPGGNLRRVKAEDIKAARKAGYKKEQ